MTARKSSTFCIRVEEARAKIEAAKERDKIDADLAKLPAPKMVASPHAEAPVADAYVANVVALLKEAGFSPSVRLVKAEEAMARALGPTCWLAFVNIMAGVGGVTHAAVARMRKPAAKPLPASEEKAPENADDFDRCIADLFEDSPAGVMKAKEIRPLAKTWFDTKGGKLVEGELWARLGQRFKCDPNNGRPRYLGLKPRVKGPPKLAVVAGRDS